MPIGTIERLEGEYAFVVMERKDMCGDCHACEIVGEVKKCELKCVNYCRGNIADQVEIDLSNQTFLKATAIMYGVPLVALLVGLGVGMLVPQQMGTYTQELAMIGLGTLFMVGSFLWIRHRDRTTKYNGLLPVAHKIVKKSS